MLRLDSILDQVHAYAPDADVGPVRKAWVFASKHHAGQLRKSGEPYFAHPLEVANILAGLRMDTETIAVAILHDTVEDTSATVADIEQAFGPDIAAMVDGVTKLDKLDFHSLEEHQAENFRKLVFAMAKDIRVIVVKLADRLHNMRTLGSMKPERQAAIAQETMDLYAPIANRLGIEAVKGELEDLSFRYLHPGAHDDLARQVEARRVSLESYIDRVRGQILSSFQGHIEGSEVHGRVKRLWSIWTKMHDKELTFEEVTDVVAFRVVVDELGQCYAALGLIHGLWAPLSDRFKDYIAQPKANGYQSLHTTIIGPEGQRIEVQIRTRPMHRFCEMGIAAHWRYKEGRLALKREELEKYTKIRQLLQWAEDIEDSREFLDVLKVDLFADQVYVYTPRGDVRWFPAGATALDFAYAVHTEVGHRCTGAKVNGRLVKLDYKLRSGDSLEILTRADQQPTNDWLRMAATSRATSKIRTYLRKAERERAIELGRELLDQLLRKYDSSIKALWKQDELRRALDEFHHRGPDELYAEVGYGHLEPDKLLPLYIDAEKLQKKKAGTETEDPGVGTLTGLFRRIAKQKPSPVKIGSVDGMLTVIAKCCRPLPGDPIVGFITRGRGITVHVSDCKQALALPPERRVDVGWDGAHQGQHNAGIKVTTIDRPMMLADLTQAIGKMKISITRAEARTSRDDRGYVMLDLAVRDAVQLRQIMVDLGKVKGVLHVERARGEPR